MRNRPAPRCSALSRWIRCAAADERGSTLIELLTVLSILGTVVASFTGVFVSASKAEVDMNTRFHAQQEARLALDQLRREGHCASGIAPAESAVAASRITFTFPGHCRPGADLAAYATVSDGVPLAATSFAVAAVGGTFPEVPFPIVMNSEVMQVTAISGAIWTVQRAQLGTTAVAHAAPAYARPGPYLVTWCTSAVSATRHVLRRVAGAGATCTGGKEFADFLVDGNVFSSIVPQSVVRRATLGVAFTVDVDPDTATRRYRLRDDIVLRNTSRTS